MALYKSTYEMLEMYPQWMKIREEESNGALFLDSPGRQLEDINSLIEGILLSGFIQTNNNSEVFNMLGVDYLYRFEIAEAITDQLDIRAYVMEGNIRQPAKRATTVYDFYKEDDIKFYFDADKYIIYFKENYSTVIINGALFQDVLSKHHVWGPLDEIGLLLGCPRVKDEVNDRYRVRLLDVFRNPGNSTNDGMKNYISRSLDIEKSKVIIKSLEDDEFIDTLMNQDGTSSDELKEYLEISNKVNTFGIDAYWEIIDEAGVGIRYLPLIWDAGISKWEKNQIQNGIGDTTDLEILQPIQEKNIQAFDYNIYAEGLNYPDRKIYPEHKFKYKVYARGQRFDEGYKPETFKYTVIASDLIPLTFDVLVNKIYKHEYGILFDGTIVAPTLVTDTNKRPNNYIISGASIRQGSYVTSLPRRYLQVVASLKTTNPTTTPKVNSITIDYVSSGIQRRVKIDTIDNISLTDNTHTVGFESNTWNHPSPLIRVRNDTNDTYRVNTTDDGGIELGRGEYERIYNSQGDWDDGIYNEDTINIKITNKGTITLDI